MEAQSESISALFEYPERSGDKFHIVYKVNMDMIICAHNQEECPTFEGLEIVKLNKDGNPVDSESDIFCRVVNALESEISHTMSCDTCSVCSD